MKTFRIHYWNPSIVSKKHPVATVTASGADEALAKFRKAHWGANILMILEVVD